MNMAGMAVVAAAVVVGGCSASSTDVVKSLPEALAKDGFVESIEVKSVPDNVSPDFRGLLATDLEKAMKVCAGGKQPLRLQVNVVEFRPQNGVATVLIGGSEFIKGTAQLIEPGSSQVVGDFEITHSMGGGGLLALAAMSGSESNMASGFAEEVCQKAFGRTSFAMPR